MIERQKKLIERLEAFSDSQELADWLRSAKTETPGGDYYLKESAEHIEGLYDLAASLAGELRHYLILDLEEAINEGKEV